MKTEFYLFNYATKSAWKGVGTSKFAKEFDSACLKVDSYKLDFNKLETTPVHLSNLSYVVKVEVVKKL